ncbi:MAG TPA: AI-2E family transporter [Bryobacteraceae bacterium]|nr:AI-2E family transporter [Bryobacteraceae bacterium]
MPALRVSSKRGSDFSPLLPLITAAVVIAALYFGKELLIPFALALLLTFLLTPPVTWLERLRLGRAVSVLIVLVLAFSIAGALLWLGVGELSGVVAGLPQYQDNIRHKLQALRSPAGPGLVSAADTLKNLKTELGANSLKAEKPPEQIARAQSRTHPLPPTPVPVEIVKHDSGILESLGLVSASLAHLLATAAAVVVLTLFMLVQRSQLRNRLFGLFGQGHLILMTTALDDAATRVSRYLLTQLLVNAAYGTLLGFTLYFIGLPYAPFWGVLAALLRFIPYLGTFVAGACPFVLSLAVFDGWQRPLLTLGAFAAIEIVISSVIEPWLYATRTGISSLAILLSAAFWTLIWGPIGLILATPLTVCLAVLGRHVPPLQFLYVMLGDEPVLTPEVRYYQRLLAMDEDEAAEIAEDALKEKSLAEVYDSVIIPALGLAEQDRHENRLDRDHAAFVFQSTGELIEEFGDRRLPEPEAQPPAPEAPPLSILCVPSRDNADELAGLMLVQLARRDGHHAELLLLADLDTLPARLKRDHIDVLLVSALPPFAVIHARSACRRARQVNPDLKIVLGLWNSALPAEKVAERLGQATCDSIVTTLAEAQALLSAAPAPQPALESVSL